MTNRKFSFRHFLFQAFSHKIDIWEPKNAKMPHTKRNPELSIYNKTIRGEKKTKSHPLTNYLFSFRPRMRYKLRYQNKVKKVVDKKRKNDLKKNGIFHSFPPAFVHPSLRCTTMTTTFTDKTNFVNASIHAIKDRMRLEEIGDFRNPISKKLTTFFLRFLDSFTFFFFLFQLFSDQTIW